MALPKLTVPTYDVTLPVCNTLVSFRPFLVKEEKLLLMAVQSKDQETMTRTILQILTNCTLTQLNVEQLAVVDIECLFLHIRARSVGETISIQYKCPNLIEGVVCETSSTYTVDLLSIQPKFYPTHQRTIALTETVGLTMKYPSLKSLAKINFATLESQKLFEFVAANIESIYDADKVYLTKEIPAAEVMEFLDTLNSAQSRKLQEFFETMPQLVTTIPFHCPKCQYEELAEVKGLQNFFS